MNKQNIFYEIINTQSNESLFFHCILILLTIIIFINFGIFITLFLFLCLYLFLLKNIIA